MKLLASLAWLGILSVSGCYVEERRHDRAYDPVCGAEVFYDSPWHEEYEGRVYYFHDRECRDRFRLRPHAFVQEHERRRYEAH